MGASEDERSLIGALEPGRQQETGGAEEERSVFAGITPEEHSILADINHIREHIETLEEAARAARAVEFDQIRAIVEQLEAVATAARAVERDLSQELATTNRLSVASARLVRDRLAFTLRALADALGVAERSG
jgi:hypothetical protein